MEEHRLTGVRRACTTENMSEGIAITRGGISDTQYHRLPSPDFFFGPIACHDVLDRHKDTEAIDGHQRL